jgi:hypothetical protein
MIAKQVGEDWGRVVCYRVMLSPRTGMKNG